MRNYHRSELPFRFVSPTSSGLSRITFLILLLLIGAYLPVLHNIKLWQLDPDGISPFSGKLPEWDFTNLWFGGKLALSGHASDLFDIEAYRAALRSTFGERIEDHEWSYPPSMLLVGDVLSLLPLRQAYAAWTLGTLALLALTLRVAGLPILIVVAVLVSPATLMNVLLGHNGALTAALLIGGLLLADRRPVIAGILFGLLTIKPHLGVLIPVCLLASRNWRAIIAAIATATTLVVLSGLIHGFDTWLGFWNITRPLMAAILEAPYPSSHQWLGTTVFLFTRSLGADLFTAYGLQCAMALTSGMLIWNVWRQPSAAPVLRMAITVTLTFLATPYAYAYDLVAFSVAVIVLIASNEWKAKPLYMVAWVWPGLVPGVFFSTSLPISPIIITFVAWTALRTSKMSNSLYSQ